MTKIHAIKVTIERTATEHVTFPVVDTKGRTFGARAYIEVYDYLPAGPEVRSPYVLTEDALGRWYHVRPHATRDGQDYGAWSHGKVFRTLAAAQDHITKYFKDAEKRALKNKNRAA